MKTRTVMESLFQADATNLNSGLDLMPKSKECTDGENHTRISPQCEKANLRSNFEELTCLGKFIQSRYWGDCSCDGTIASAIKKMNPSRSDDEINITVNAFLSGSEKGKKGKKDKKPNKPENETAVDEKINGDDIKETKEKNDNPVKRIDECWVQVLATLIDKYFEDSTEKFWKREDVIENLENTVSAMTAIFGLDLFNAKFPPIDSALQVGHVVSINKQRLLFDDFICQDDIVQQGAAHLGVKFLSAFDIFHRHYVFDKNVFCANYKKDDKEERAKEAIEQIIKASYNMKYAARKNNTSTVGSAEFYVVIKGNESAPTFFNNELFNDKNGDNNSKKFVESYLNGWINCINQNCDKDVEIAYITTIEGLSINQCSFIKKLNDVNELIAFAKE